MLTSLIRTIVPFVVALVGPWLLAHAGVTPEQLSSVLTVVVGAAYYVAVRVLETRMPRAGVLLGRAVAPTYPTRQRANQDAGPSSSVRADGQGGAS